MPYYIRPMIREDIKQVAEIDREAFPTMLPPPNFERELRNKLTHYIVVCDEEKYVEQSEIAHREEEKSGLVTRIKRFFNQGSPSGEEASVRPVQYVNGYVGFWVMGDEAHITTIAVRESLRQQGIGELLIITVLNKARELKVSTVTLEVRVTNTIAQNLYEKYGFKKVGVRKGYYTDNREDGLMMSTDDINSASFQAQLKRLEQAHSGQWGAARHYFRG